MTDAEKIRLLRRELAAFVSGIDDLVAHWPKAECDNQTEELCGYLMLVAVAARTTLYVTDQTEH